MSFWFGRSELFEVQRFRKAIAEVVEHFIRDTFKLFGGGRKRLVPAFLVMLQSIKKPSCEYFLFGLGHYFGSLLEGQFESSGHSPDLTREG